MPSQMIFPGKSVHESEKLSSTLMWHEATTFPFHDTSSTLRDSAEMNCQKMCMFA